MLEQGRVASSEKSLGQRKTFQTSVIWVVTSESSGWWISFPGSILMRNHYAFKQKKGKSKQSE